MLAHPTLDQLRALGLLGMAKAFESLDASEEAKGLSHAEWLGLLPAKATKPNAMRCDVPPQLAGLPENRSSSSHSAEIGLFSHTRKSRKKSVLVGFKPTKNRPKPTKSVELPEIIGVCAD